MKLEMRAVLEKMMRLRIVGLKGVAVLDQKALQGLQAQATTKIHCHSLLLVNLSQKVSDGHIQLSKDVPIFTVCLLSPFLGSLGCSRVGLESNSSSFEP